jgi:hypothetical protein
MTKEFKSKVWSNRRRRLVLLSVLLISFVALGGWYLGAASGDPSTPGGPAGSFTPPKPAPPAPPASFTVQVNPGTQQIYPGYADSFTVTVTPKNGFTGAVSLALSPALPSGMSTTWTSNPVTITGNQAVTTTLIVNSTSGLATGNYNFTVTGTSGALSATAPLKVEVQKLPAKYYTLSLSPSSQPLAPGSPAVYTITVNRFGQNDKVQLAMDSILPPGVTATFNPASVDGPPKPQTSTLTLTATQAVSPFPFAVSGKSGGFNIDVVGNVTSASASSIAASSGTPQSATVNTAFGASLVALVKDASNHPVSGVTVTFTAPSTGASGTFPGSSLTATATTNGSGLATAPTFTANTTAGAYSVTASASGAGSAGFSLTNNAGAAFSIAVSTGSGQSQTVGVAFSNPLVAIVKDQYGNVKSGATVTFTPPASGASGSFSGGNTAVTNASGLATSSTFTANHTAGGYNVSASTSGAATPASFAETNLAGSASTIAVQSGSNQSQTVGVAFSAPLVALVSDQYGNPVSGAVVTFTAPGSGASGTFANTTATTTANTNASGAATSSTFTANHTAGAYNVSASTPGTTSVNFHLTNTAGGVSSISVSSGAPQSATVHHAFSDPLVALVRDQYNNPISGVTVTFTAPGSGASGTFANTTATTTASTNGSGLATSSTFTANTTAGSYNVAASAPSAGSTNFALTNNADVAASITVSSGSSQHKTVGMAFANPLVALVKDQYNNPVSGATVTFTPPVSGASATFSSGNTAITDGSGLATSSTVSANHTAGSYNVAGSTSGVVATALFALTNDAGAATTIAIQSGSGQSQTVGLNFTNPLVAVVTDTYGNPVSGQTVTWTPPASGASGTFAAPGNTATTNSSGVATSQTFQANTVAGSYNVAAAASGTNTVQFAMTNNAGTATKLKFITSPQTIAAGDATGTITVERQDTYGNPVSGSFTVNLATSSADGVFRNTLDSATITFVNVSSSADASFLYRDTAAGTPLLTASSSGITSATQQVTVNAGVPTTIFVNPASEAWPVAFTFPLPFKASITDAYDNPVPGAVVTWTAPGSGASGTFADTGTNTTSSLANNHGVATAPAYTSNTIAGAYTVTVSATGPSPGFGGFPAMQFVSVTNQPGPSSKLVWVQEPSDAKTNVAISPAPSVQVEDQYGNHVPDSGRGVTMHITGSPSFPSGAIVLTDANGLATFSALAFDTAGTYTIYAHSGSLTDTPDSVSFTITNSAQPYTISATVPTGLVPGGDAQPIPVTFDSPNQGNNGSGVDGTQVSNLTVSISGVTGGSAGPHPCTAADFAITQIPAGQYPFYVPFGTSTLASLIGSGNLPMIQMVNQPWDQNACRGATVHLSFTGTP